MPPKPPYEQARRCLMVVLEDRTENSPFSDERSERLLRVPDTGRQRSISEVGASQNWHRHTMEATLNTLSDREPVKYLQHVARYVTGCGYVTNKTYCRA